MKKLFRIRKPVKVSHFSEFQDNESLELQGQTKTGLIQYQCF